MNFPRGFYFGAATSAHQVEGSNHNDWAEWEKENAGRLAEEASQKSWPDFILNKRLSPLKKENYISGRAADHYNRYKEDFDLAKELGHNAHRFSMEWSRIQPEEDKFNEKEIKHYREVVRALKKRGLEPFVTLWHYALPLWLRDKGGVISRDFPGHFSRYAERMAEALPEVRFWITLNEANVYTGRGCWNGSWPPNRSSLYEYFLANRRLARAHAAAHRAIKNLNPNAQIGVAHNVIWFTKKFAGPKRFLWNHSFVRSIKNQQDFIGLNYYRSDRDTKNHSEFLNWPIDPQGLFSVIKEMSMYQKPIYITENGIADARDANRAEFIREHLKWLNKAVEEGMDVRGYFHWSLLDNFEWDKGFWPRFGLVEVDYKTMARKVRPSALVYKGIIKGK